MHRRFPPLFSALLAGLLLLAPEAEARFGKRSSSRSKPRSAAKPSRTPRASAHPRSFVVAGTRSSPRYATAPAAAPASVSASLLDSPDEPRKHLLFGFDVQAVGGGGGGMALHLGLEFGRIGFNLRGGGLSLRADDGSGGRDLLSLVSTHLSYAVLTGERGRVRVEGGLSVIGAPDATFVGPSLGGSAEYFLFDSLAVEGRMHLTPVPHRQLDTSGGLAFYFLEGLFALRGGMRMLVLDDAGLVDGVIHRDLLAGPYLSLGLSI